MRFDLGANQIVFAAASATNKSDLIMIRAEHCIRQLRPARTVCPPCPTICQSTKISRTCEAPPPYKPDNGFAEGVVGWIRRDCVDPVIVFGEALSAPKITACKMMMKSAEDGAPRSFNAR
jgi:hypothetical protein